MTTTTASPAQSTTPIVHNGLVGAPTFDRVAQQMIQSLAEEYYTTGVEQMEFTFNGTSVVVGIDDTARDVVRHWTENRVAA